VVLEGLKAVLEQAAPRSLRDSGSHARRQEPALHRTLAEPITAGSSEFAPADKPKIVVAVLLEFGLHGSPRAHIASAIIGHYLKVGPIKATMDEDDDRPIVSDVRLLAAAYSLRVRCRDGLLRGQTDTPTAVASLYKSQIVWLLIGMVRLAVGHSSVRFIEWMTTPLYLFSIFLLGLTLVIGKGAGTAASTKSWLAIGSHRIGQPPRSRK